MKKKKKVKYVVYKTTNKVNGKFYIGYHKTDNINDNYLGSGVILKKAINKYGASNFSKEILKVFNSSKAALSYERKMVNHEDPLSYNMVEGGGGFSLACREARNKTFKKARNDPNSKLEKNRRAACSTPEYLENLRRFTSSKEYREKMRAIVNSPEYRKKHSVASSKGVQKFWSNPENRKRATIKRLKTRQIKRIMKLCLEVPDFSKRLQQFLGTSDIFGYLQQIQDSDKNPIQSLSLTTNTIIINNNQMSIQNAPTHKD